MLSGMNCVHAILCLCGLSLVVTQYPECFRYCPPDEPLTVTSAQAICRSNGTCLFCRYFPNNCPEITSCNNDEMPIPTEDGRCAVCPEEPCAYDSKRYKVSDTFTSLDTISQCSCTVNATVECKTEITLDVLCQ